MCTYDKQKFLEIILDMDSFSVFFFFLPELFLAHHIFKKLNHTGGGGETLGWVGVPVDPSLHISFEGIYKSKTFRI